MSRVNFFLATGIRTGLRGIERGPMMQPKRPVKRPEHLPDYENPPLDEVVLGVQFQPPPNYTSIHASKVWDLFREEFPLAEEHPSIPPQFETFGGLNISATPQIRISTEPPPGSRFWFISGNRSHLVQFQPDRFTTNWRRRSDAQPYPHFEGLAPAFRTNLEKLAGYFKSDLEHGMSITQAEVSYINIIPVETFAQIGKWFEFWKDGDLDIEALNTGFSEVRKNNDSEPYARLNHSIETAIGRGGKQRAFILSLVFKGKPLGTDISSALDFLVAGREAIVTRFEEITTEEAQELWGKMK